MLYVYQVDTGTMLTFDMNLAMESVSKLQEVIAKTCRISEDKQVLLISGGENLDPNARVCSYAAGTDTNPIFLFSKSTIEAATPPSASVNYGSEADLKEQVDGALGMPPTYDTVVARAQLALQFHDVAKDELRVCERLVHDQHLQHQGWAAVVANLEDITSAFRSRAEIFRRNVDDYVSSRESHLSMLNRFPNQVQLLSKIPILPCLLREMQSIDVEVEEDSDGDTWGFSHKPKSLLDWISAQDSRSTLDHMAQQCHIGIDQFDEKLRDNLIEEVQKIIVSTDNPGMKEVKGLEDRLSGLEQLMFGARKIVQEQSDMAQGFVQNQNRARSLSDPSVLPDLCIVHRGQLSIMLKNHQSMRDIRRRCTLAKEELSINLHTRLRWVMYVEKSICDVDSRLVIHHETMKKLKRKLEIVQQMASAPELYCKAVVEVVRRKTFTDQFLEWAGSLADESLQVHKMEVEMREEFLCHLRHHFLRSLFPGIDDMPPPFATKSPEEFDDHLPPVTADDIEFIKSEVPELAERLRVPDVGNVPVGKHSSTSTLRATASVLSAARRDGLSPIQDLVSSDIVVLNHEDPTDEADPPSAYFSTDRREPDLSHSVEVIVQEDSDNGQLDLALNEKNTPPARTAPARTAAPPKAEAKRETCHSVESPEGGPPTKIEKRDSKSSTLGTSPEGEEDSPSGGFTTADFYIDESMPSSMTESAPSKKIAELQLNIQDKNVLLESREREIEDKKAVIDELKSRLGVVEDSFKLLQDVCEKGSLQLRCDVLNHATSFQKDKDEFQTFIDSITKKLVGTIANFEEKQNVFRDETVSTAKQEFGILLQESRHELEVATQKLDDAHREIEIYQRKLDEKCLHLDALKEETQCTIDNLNAENEEKVKKEKNQLVLEHEVELEKVRSELEFDISSNEQKMTEMQETIDRNARELDRAKKAKETLEGDLLAHYQTEKDQVVKIMKDEFSEKKKAYEANMEMKSKDYEKQIGEESEAKQTELRLSLEKKYDETLAGIRVKMDEEKESATREQERDSEARLSHKLSELERDLCERHARVTQELKAGFEEDRRSLVAKQEQENVQSSTTESESDCLSMQQHLDLVAELKEKLETEKSSAIAEILESKRREHQAAVDEIAQKIEMDKQSMRTSLVAEKQVNFNEALNKVVEEKDKVIEELRLSEKALLAEREKDKDLIKTLQSQDGATDLARDRDRESRMIQQRLEEELGLAKQQILLLQSEMHQQLGSGGAMGHSMMAASVMPVSDHLTASRVQDLEAVARPRNKTKRHTLRTREDEVSKLHQKVMEMSMTASSRVFVQDKVSITTCNIGDVVLLCLDERHDHYVVFTVGTTLHFLHADCLDPLGLKTEVGEHKKSWVLAEITDKEYCQAKKAQNRFKVPIGTKFYRVKARPWSRGEGLGAAHQTEAAAPESTSPR